MRRLATIAAAAVLALAGGCTGGGSPTAPASSGGGFAPGAAGIGDPYFPKSGNGGYDVAGYDLTLRYDPADDRLTGRALITASATAGLSRFDLELAGLTVESVSVNGAAA